MKRFVRSQYKDIAERKRERERMARRIGSQVLEVVQRTMKKDVLTLTQSQIIEEFIHEMQ